MKKRTIVLLATSLILGICCNLCGQDDEPKKQWFEKHPLDFAFGNFSVGMPFTDIFIRKFYPMATIGTEFYYMHKTHSQIYQTAKLGGFYNKYSTSAIIAITEIGYRYSFGFGLFADANLGVGYSHLFRPNAIFKLNSNGKYEQSRDWGSPSLLANYALTIGYDCTKQLQKSISVFLRYGNYIQLLYNPDIPALPQNSLQLGVRFLIN